ncbi:methyltransferase [Shewanella sp. JM162201]|uniref:Ribosomal RNA large subunit methyltransferase G n=1 Tax=Shewanella jiangmenensis TaxID=2837387 RepID=A0ABS5V2J4_9GAMM|nr:methyltransferase [Shewanella jiangmenensis]MBT1444672.1 methyltransferase [Shewanella jiangmenensis]
MTSRFSAGADDNRIELSLHRYPDTSDANLQAWDAADEHLLKHLMEQGLGNHSHIVLVNDSFGALTCALRALYPALKLTFAADSRTSHLGCKANLDANALNADNIEFKDCSNLASVATGALVLMKLPKSLTFFADTLCQLSQAEGETLLIGAKAKNINQSLLSLIGKHFGNASASLAWKKTRVISAISDGKARSAIKPIQWQVPEFQLSISNLSNVFGAAKLDIGARLMLSHLPEGSFSEVIDLGCGNGVLGLRAAQMYPTARVHFVDESAMAVASAAQNWQQNGFDATRADFHWDDCLSHLSADISADLILCNPPFHQGEAITDHIAWQMFNDAKRRLQYGGLLHVVGNRHLGYHVKLKRLFGNCQTISSNGKFVILQAKKQ